MENEKAYTISAGRQKRFQLRVRLVGNIFMEIK